MDLINLFKSALLDYKIKSEKIFFYTVLSTFIIVFALLIAEVSIGLYATTPEFLGSFLLGFLIILILYKRKVSLKMLPTLNLFLLLILIEGHAIRTPTIFHVIIYWMGFIPIIAIITTGVRQSFFWMLVTMIIIIGNGIYFGNVGYQSYDIKINIDGFIIVGIIFSLSIYASSYLLYRLLGNAFGQLKIASQELSEMHLVSELKKEKMGRFMEVIFGLSKNNFVLNGEVQEVIALVAKLACQTLGNNRVSIWLLNEGEDENLECLYAFDQKDGIQMMSALKKSDFPNYFQVIKENHVVMASDVYADPALQEFVATYFTPLEIYSMLDAPFFIGNRIAGVICCENRFEKKEWIPEDLLFLQSLSDLISITYKNKETKQHLEQIRSQNLELRGQRTTMEELNHELATINEKLEEKVKDRTAVLEAKNKQLTEYAFVNSHLLRAPLARILGLSYLLTRSIDGKQDQELVNGLISSSEELDTIIQKISDLLYDGNNFSREEVQEIIRKNLNE